MHLPIRAGFAAAAVALGALAQSASGQSSTDPLNIPNVTVTAHTPVFGATNNNDPAVDGVYNIFGATNPAVEATDRAIFSDDNPAFVNFSIAPVGPGLGIAGVTLYEESDGATEGASRGVSSFSLLADADNDGTYETTLLSGVNPIDTGTPLNTFAFPTTGATRFRAEFFPNPGVQFPGARILELDGIAGVIPEPAALSLLALAGVSMLRRGRGGPVRRTD